MTIALKLKYNEFKYLGELRKEDIYFLQSAKTFVKEFSFII